MEDFDQTVGRCHEALAEFVKGNPDAVLRTWSQREDVVLCNPFLPFARGPAAVQETISRAASHFADGEYTIETVEKYVGGELGYTVEIERFRAKVDGSEESGALRVTTIFRLEDGNWKVTHRHADPITTPRPTDSILQQ